MLSAQPEDQVVASGVIASIRSSVQEKDDESNKISKNIGSKTTSKELGRIGQNNNNDGIILIGERVSRHFYVILLFCDPNFN